jgi:hypothetical protein
LLNSVVKSIKKKWKDKGFCQKYDLMIIAKEDI